MAAKLTPEQRKKIVGILKNYRAEADRIVQSHRKKVTGILEDLDRKKIQELEALIKNS